MLYYYQKKFWTFLLKFSKSEVNYFNIFRFKNNLAEDIYFFVSAKKSLILYQKNSGLFGFEVFEIGCLKKFVATILLSYFS